MLTSFIAGWLTCLVFWCVLAGCLTAKAALSRTREVE